jgi:hypothetical protein
MKALIEGNTNKLDSINHEKATFRGSMNNIKFIVEVRCDVSYPNGGVEMGKLVSFSYCPYTETCYCFHDAELNFYNCSFNVFGLDKLKIWLASVYRSSVCRHLSPATQK